MDSSVKKYTVDGREVDVVQRLDNGHYLIYDVVEACDEEYQCSYPRTVDRLFDEPPAAKFAEQINLLKVELKALRDEKRLLQADLRDLNKKSVPQMNKFKRYEQLRYLEDFLDGKITHYMVVGSWDLKILTLKETISKYGRYPQQLRLLGLFGDAEGNLAWRLNEYQDGSGSWTEVIPCKSYEDALEEARRCTDNMVADAMSDGKVGNDRVIEAAKKYNLHIPDSYIQLYNDSVNEAKRDKVAKAERELEKLRAEALS